MKKQNHYPCRYCGNLYKTKYESDLCMELDLRQIIKAKKESKKQPKKSTKK